MVGPRHTSPATEQLRAACAAELSALQLPADGIVAAAADPAGWRLMVTAAGRTFHFGTLGAPRFFFVELAGGREEDLVAGLPPPSQDDRVLWRYAFWLLRHALQSHPGRAHAPDCI